jgi:hypothetical protein
MSICSYHREILSQSTSSAKVKEIQQEPRHKNGFQTSHSFSIFATLKKKHSSFRLTKETLGLRMGCKFSSNVKSRIITSLTTRARRNAGSFTSGNHSTQLALLSMSGYFLLIGFGPGKRHNRNYSVKVHKPKKNF